MSREGRIPRLVEPDEMVTPLLYIVSREADNVNGCRFDASLWDSSQQLDVTAAIGSRVSGPPLLRQA